MPITPGMLQQRFHPSTEPPEWFTRWVGGGWETDAGVDVTPDSAMMVMAYLACVRIISDTIATLPLITYERLARGKRRATDHYLYPVLHDEANSEMSAFTFRRLLLTHQCTRGNGIAEIEFDRGGRVRALWPLNPDKVHLWRDPDSKELFYVYRLPQSVGGHEAKISAERIFHVKWLSNNGLWALSPVQLARNAVALAMATEKNGSLLFGNGSEPGVMLKTPKALSDKAYNRIQSDWEEMHKGLEKRHRIAILEEGLEVEKLSVDPDDAQFLQTRVHQVSEFGRLFGISDDMLNQQGASATYASVEQFGLRFTTFTIRPWTVGFEQEAHRVLLAKSEKPKYFCEHLVDGLMRGDTVARMNSQAQGFMVGKYSVNDMLEMDNQNPIPGKLGDTHFVPLNMVPLDQAGSQQDAGAANNSRAVLNPLYEDVFRRIHRRMVQDIESAQKRAKDDAQKLSDWLRDFFAADIRTYMAAQLIPPLRAHYALAMDSASDDVIHDVAGQLAREYCEGAERRTAQGIDSSYFDFLLQQSMMWTDDLSNRSVPHAR